MVKLTSDRTFLFLTQYVFFIMETDGLSCVFIVGRVLTAREKVQHSYALGLLCELLVFLIYGLWPF